MTQPSAKSARTTYWIGVALTSLWFGASGFFELTTNPIVCVFFDILFAFFSKIAVIGFGAAIDAIVAFVMVSVTYIMFRKVYPAAYTSAA